MMTKLSALNRRQWLKSVSATLAGLLIARRLPGAALAQSGAAPAVPSRQKTDRRYIHGFEAYPAA